MATATVAPTVRSAPVPAPTPVMLASAPSAPPSALPPGAVMVSDDQQALLMLGLAARDMLERIQSGQARLGVDAQGRLFIQNATPPAAPPTSVPTVAQAPAPAGGVDLRPSTPLPPPLPAPVPVMAPTTMPSVPSPAAPAVVDPTSAAREVQGWSLLRLGRHEDAADQFTQAYQAERSLGAARGLVTSLHALKAYGRLLDIARASPGPLDQLLGPDVRERIAAGDTRFLIDDDARLVGVGRAPTPAPASAGAGGMLAGGVLSLKIEPMLRGKQGKTGEGRLSQRGVEVTAAWERGGDSLTLRLHRERASDGEQSASGSRFYALGRHGFGNGWEVRAGLGRSLGGGAVKAATVGELGLRYDTAEWGMGARLFRRGNEESLLALTGRQDALSGVRWGRVLATGLGLDAQTTWRGWEALGSVTLASLAGQGVASNRMVEFYGRALTPVASVPGLKWGPEAYYSQYSANLSAFEPGHGGYFSPSRFIKLGAVASYETQVDRLSLNMLGGLGWGWNRQAAAAGNPLTGTSPGAYPSGSSNGLAYHGRIDGLWPVSPQWHLGFSMAVQRSPDFNDWRASVFAKRIWGE